MFFDQNSFSIEKLIEYIQSDKFTGRHDILRNETQHNETQHYETQHDGLICDNQHKRCSAL